MYGYYSQFLFVFIPSTCLLCLILHPFETTTKEITTTILFLADFLEEHRRVLESRLQPVIGYQSQSWSIPRVVFPCHVWLVT
jgi:hypothetical protein